MTTYLRRPKAVKPRGKGKAVQPGWYPHAQDSRLRVHWNGKEWGPVALADRITDGRFHDSPPDNGAPNASSSVLGRLLVGVLIVALVVVGGHQLLQSRAQPSDYDMGYSYIQQWHDYGVATGQGRFRLLGPFNEAYCLDVYADHPLQGIEFKGRLVETGEPGDVREWARGCVDALVHYFPDQPGQTTTPTQATAAPETTAVETTAAPVTCPVPYRIGDSEWSSVTCSDGSPNPAVRDDLKDQAPNVMALPASSSWDAVTNAMCTDWTASGTVHQAYEYMRALHKWNTYRPGAEVPEALGVEFCTRPGPMPPRFDCPLPNVMQNGSFDTVLCADGSPNGRIKDDLIDVNPAVMALGDNPTFTELTTAVCSDLANGSTNMITSGAYRWKNVEQAWYHMPDPDDFVRRLVDEDWCSGSSPAGLEVHKFGDTALLSKVTLTVNDGRVFSMASSPDRDTVGALVEICAREPVTIGPIPWTMTDDQGHSYNPVSPVAIPELNPRYPSGKALAAGQCASGWLAFELPSSRDALSFEYITTYGDAARWIPA